MKINSIWETEIGTWDEYKCKYTDRKITVDEKELDMVIIEGIHGPIVRFVGGPTGHESYYIEDLLSSDFTKGDFYICAGTINRWSACKVKREEVLNFICN